MSTKYESYTAADDGNANIADDAWEAQTFTSSITHIVTSVKLYLSRSGSPGTVTVSIRATLADIPTGADLASGTTSGNSITGTEWREITFSAGALVIAGTKYAIVVRAPDGVKWSNYLNWRRQQSNPYANGSRSSSTDSGASWAEAADHDCLFEEWGNPEGGGAGGNIFPTDAITRVTSLTHRFNRGTYTLELGLGEVVADFGIPGVESIPRRALTTEEEGIKRVMDDVRSYGFITVPTQFQPTPPPTPPEEQIFKAPKRKPAVPSRPPISQRGRDFVFPGFTRPGEPAISDKVTEQRPQTFVKPGILEETRRMFRLRRARPVSIEEEKAKFGRLRGESRKDRPVGITEEIRNLMRFR